jgi:putative membrane-bound dehydrogenase-like protein
MKNQRFLPTLTIALLLPAFAFADPGFDANALPKVPPEFEVKFFAKEPLVRQPCSMAFDAKGRLFVGMGPQYREPTPTTPGDSVVIVQDTDGDGAADKIKVFATGFNCIQSLAWRGRDLWVANAPDLTVVRDLDGDDEADEYVRIYTDLGNLEHALHGLNWAPDGKLYMSKGNSKGYSNPKESTGPAPRAFMKLWHRQVHPDWPAFPEPVRFTKHNYKKAYHTPPDDQGREGGVLRCDDDGGNLEIVSRGMRNPWDITLDDGFNWLGTDNDADQGDRVFMPFWNAHFGWSHPWSAHWGPQPHPPTAPVSGPLFGGSGTGIIYCDSPQMPPAYRGVFLVNDWARKTTFVWRPTWDGALLTPRPGDGPDGGWQPLVQGDKSLFRPTDVEIGPDGALWILGWSAAYGSTLKNDDDLKNGKWTNEGRVFHVRWKDAPPAAWNTPKRSRPLSKWSIAELLDDFTGPLPVWRIDAADELVRRGAAVKANLIAALESGRLSTMQETWTAWTLGRIAPEDATIEAFLARAAAQAGPRRERGPTGVHNLRIQAVRILAHRVRQHQKVSKLPPSVIELLRSDEPRLRFAAVDAIVQARQTAHASALIDLLATETDRVTYYAAWQGLRGLLPQPDLKRLLADHRRAGVRKAALLALLETHSLTASEIGTLADGDPDGEVVRVARLRLVGKTALASSPTVTAASSAGAGVSLVANVKAESRNHYRSVPGGMREGGLVYTDRSYAIREFPPSLALAELLQTSQDDDGSRGDKFLAFDALVPLRVRVGLDARIPVPQWLRKQFRQTDEKITSSNTTYHIFTREIPEPGRVELGGNTEQGGGGISNYMVVLEPLPLAKLTVPTTLAQGLEQLPKGDARRGELLFKRVAGCAKCHSLSQLKNSFGPQLADIGYRAPAKHIVESIVAPDAHITEGFTQHSIETTDGKVVSGVILQETDLAVTLGTSTLERLVIGKDKIEDRQNQRKSAMPSFGELLTPGQVADVAAFLLTQRVKPGDQPDSSNRGPDKPRGNSETTPSDAPAATPAPLGTRLNDQPPKPVIAANSKFALDLKADRLTMKYAERPLAEYVFSDPTILRPYFANLHGPTGTKITRNHPPVSGKDATDHATMHPGIWFGFGDISGVDFWRNRGRIQHVRFLTPPTATEDRITFATESQLLTPDGKPMGTMVNRFVLSRRPAGWRIVWDATFTATESELIFGDQEEMGFGARIASECTETKGGTLLNSHGVKSAKATWGKPAAWCDYSGTKDGRRIGITLMPAPTNFRESWWHNRDYGVFVANAFGRAAMKQGAKSAVTVKKGDSLRLVFGAMLHDANDFDPATEYRHFVKTIR